MKRSRWFSVTTAAMALTLVAAACGGGGDDGGGGGGSVEKIPVTVYFQGALTGPVNFLVVPSFQAAQVRVDELNADDSFPAEITFVEGDTQGDPANAPQIVEQAVSDPETVAIHGPAFSGESAASGDTYNDAAIPFVTSSATATSLREEGWDYWYRAVGNDAGQGPLVGQYLTDVLKAKSLFVSHDKSEYGQPLAETVRDTAEEGGAEIAGFEGITTGEEDFSALISAVEASGADSFYFGGYDADFGKIVKQARDSGLQIPMMSSDGSLSSTFIDLAGAGADNVHLSAPTNIGGGFIDKYNQEVGGEASSVPVYAAEGYDVVSMIGEGIKQAIDGGAEDPEGIREGIKEYMDSLTVDSPYQGEAKAYAFDDNHEVTAQNPDSLYNFYEVTGGEVKGLGTAPEVLGG
ncbi:MAG: branched-chain amino acid ABC transporter substrate-binding protein [Actinomycetota bacterium]|nr:branched-chain amino acid ABC transporter substrate-binding protein [Actinomycetota bacterium]